MRKLFSFVFIGIFSVMMLTACGKSSSDNSGLLALLGLGGGTEPPVAGSFSKHVFGTGTPSSTSVLFNSSASEGRFMILNLASDIKGAGVISSISFRFNGYHAGTTTCSNVTIKMGHTSKTTLDTTFLNNVETAGGSKGSFVQVFSGTVTIPEGASGTYFTIPLDTPFYYNGVDNLVMEIVRTSAATNAVEISAPTPSLGDSYMVFSTGAGASADTEADSYTSNFPYTRLNFAGGDDTIVYGTDSNGLPFWTDEDDRRVQMLYKAADINGSGSITGVGFQIMDKTLAEYTFTVTVQLGHGASDELVNTSWDANFSAGSSVIVARDAVITVPIDTPAGSWIWVPLNGSFNYDGTSSLVVDVDVTDSSEYTMSLMIDNGGTNTRLDGSSSTPAYLSDVRYNVKFRFNGGTADVITAGTTAMDYIFRTSQSSKHANLYLSSELGTGGYVTGMALRLNADSSASTYDDFTVMLGHVADSGIALGVTYAGSMTNDTTVFSGTLTIPAGMKAGDWLEIPFTRPFKYDARKNLMVLMSSLQGSAANDIRGEFASPRYQNRQVAGEYNTSISPSWGGCNLADIRLTIEKR